MKTNLLIIILGCALALAACNGKQADKKNADSMSHYADSTTLDTNTMDSTQSNIMADSTTNAPADAGH